MIEKLHSYWSPDQISGYLKRLGIPRFRVCMETIYQFIYSDEGKRLGLYRYLFKSRKKRRNLYGRAPRKSRVLEHHGIAYRPMEVNERGTFGHWEGDLMIFHMEHGKYNLTSLIERKSRYMVLAKNDNRKPEPVMHSIADKLKPFPNLLTQTITFDRGFEF
ncbi:IS30 family transposase, partial [Aquimarina macrocephali]|uniref:IS30 family transposase n=1 Tax=Aquimarina macrocephali TaxID=666563 RepID=UPI001F4CBC12